jgi:hypothetical protein
MDLDRLISDLRTTAALLHALKRQLRTAGHRTTPLEARDLNAFKARATRLCALRAHLRGRVHLRPMTLEEQAAFVDEERQIYSLKAA